MNIDELRQQADEEEGAGRASVAGMLRDAADEIARLRRVRDGMTPPPDVRLMHYRCAAVPLVWETAHAMAHYDEIAKQAEMLAQDMLAAEVAP